MAKITPCEIKFSTCGPCITKNEFVSYLPYMFRNMKIHSPSSFNNSQIESVRETVTSILTVDVLLPLPKNCSNIRSEDSYNMAWSWDPVILVILSQQWRIIENVSKMDRKGSNSELKEHNGSGRVQSNKNYPLTVLQQETFSHHLLTLQDLSHFKLSLPNTSIQNLSSLPLPQLLLAKSLQHSHI